MTSKPSTPFTIQKLWYYIHPTLSTMSHLSKLVSEIKALEMTESLNMNGLSEMEKLLLKKEKERAAIKYPFKQKRKGGGAILTCIWNRMGLSSG